MAAFWAERLGAYGSNRIITDPRMERRGRGRGLSPPPAPPANQQPGKTMRRIEMEHTFRHIFESLGSHDCGSKFERI